MKMQLELPGSFDFKSLSVIEDKPFSLEENGGAVLFVIDMNKGFCEKGALASERIAKIVPDVVKTVEIFARANAPIVAFTDRHTKDAEEFSYLPAHCVEGTEETELVDALLPFSEKMTVFGKNSTNGFMQPDIQEQIHELVGEGYCRFVIVGCCTDICVKTFAITLITFFNQENMKMDIIVPIDAVETYDAPGHDAAAMNLFALYDMRMNGIRLVPSITD